MTAHKLDTIGTLRLALCAAAAFGTALTTPTLRARQAADSAPQCRPDGGITKVPALPEGSGVAASRRVPGRLWALNDSGQPMLIALDTRGAVTGRTRLKGAAVDDWEAIAVGPCPAGSCVYVADIGDNDAERKRISVYRVPEPAGSDETVEVRDVYHATYPDGAHDAEALIVAPDGTLFIVTKGDTGPVAMYRFPRELRPGATVTLEPVGKPRAAGKPGAADRITDGAVSPDASWIVLRTNGALLFHRTADLTAGNWREARRIDVREVGEPQGEGVAFGEGNAMFLVGEGGGKAQAGTFVRLTCAP